MEHFLWLFALAICIICQCSAVISPIGGSGSLLGRRRETPPCPSNCYCSLDSVRCDFWPSPKTEQTIRLPERTKVLSFYNWPSQDAKESFFDDIVDLQWLRLSGGHLIKFPTFGVLNHLSYVDLSDNRITSLPSKAFQNASFVTHLNVSGNSIQEVSSEFLSGLKQLRALDLSRNPGLLQLPVAFFDPVISLRFLDLSKTNINVFFNNLTNSLQNLYFLNISFNNIPSLPPLKLTTLEILDASYNPLTTLPRLEHLPNLRELYVSHTHILNLNFAVIKGCNRLQILDISYSNLSNLNEEVLSNCRHLREINLSHNLNLWRIEHGALSNLVNLTVLRLNNCPNLYDLEDDSFTGLINLRELYLQESGVKILPFSLSQLHNLSFVNLEGTFLLCDCYANWLPKLLNTTDLSSWKGINPLQCHNGIHMSLIDLQAQLKRLECAGVSSYTVPNQWTLAPWGQSALLECNVTGTPTPKIVWQTVDHRLLIFNKSMNDHPWLHHQIVEALSIADAPTEGKYQVLQSGQLLVRNVSRTDIGRYKCFAYNPVSNTSVVTFLGIQDTLFRAFVLESILFGFACAALFLFITLLVQFIKFVMERLGWECWCCRERLSPKAKQIRQLIESIETYKSAQLDRLKDNYNSQVVSIKDSCYSQMERLRESYAHQSKNLKDLCDYSTQQITGARDQYLDQVNKVRDYSVGQMNRVRENYVFQRHRIRKFSGHQLLRLRETYKYQQKTLNKLLETLPDLYIQNCRTGSCQRTDSIVFDNEIAGLDIYYKVDFFDTQSSGGSDYYTPSSTLTRHSRNAKLNHSRNGSNASDNTEYQEAHSWVLKPGSIRNDKVTPHERFHSRSFSLAAPPSAVHRTLMADEHTKGHHRSSSASSHPSPQHFFPTTVLEETGELISPPAAMSSVVSPKNNLKNRAAGKDSNTLLKELEMKLHLISSLSKCETNITPTDLEKGLGKASKKSDQIPCDSEPTIDEGNTEYCDKQKDNGSDISLETSM